MKKETSVNECALCHLIFILPQTLAEHLKRLHPEIGKDKTTKKSNSEPRNLLKLGKKQRKSKKKRHLSGKSMQDLKSAILLEHRQNLQKVELVQKNYKLNLCNLSERNVTVPKISNLEIVKQEVSDNHFQRNIPKPLKCDSDTRIIGIVSSNKSYRLESIIKTEPEKNCDVDTGVNQLNSIIKTESEEIFDFNTEDNQLKSISKTESEEMCDVNTEDNQLKSAIKTESEEMCDVDSEDKVENSSIKDANTAKGTIFYESKENIVANEAYPFVQGYL